MYDTNTLNQLNSRNIAQRLLGKPVQSRTKYDKYYSPFRDDGRQAGLTVYDNGFKDYGGEGNYWSNIDFVMQVLTLSYQDACAWLNGESRHIPTVSTQKRTSHSQPPSPEWQKTAFNLLAQCEDTLWNTPQGHQALAYLKQERGLSEVTIRKFRLGCNADWQAIRINGEQSKLAPGIIIPWLVDTQIYALRIRTPQGKLSAYTGQDARYFEDKDKYLSLKGSRQSSGLFGAVAGLANRDSITLLEGEFDTMLFNQMSGAVAVTRGSAGDHRNISSNWLEQLQGATVVYGLLDNDQAGQGASDALFDALPNYVPLNLPAGKDFTDYVTQHQGTVAHIWQQVEQATREATQYRQQREVETALIERDKIQMSDWAQQVQLAPLTATLVQNLAYISEIDPTLLRQQRTVLVKSPLGTGKTELIKRRIADFIAQHGREPKVLYLTSTVALVENSAERLGLDSYRDVPEGYRVPFERVACSINSAPNLQETHYDIVVFDELESSLPYLATSGTMKSVDLQRAYKAVKQRIQQAGQFIGLDAHLSDNSRQIIEAWRGASLAIVNQPQRDPRPLSIHRRPEHVIQSAMRQAQANVGTVVITTNSKTLSYAYRDLFADELGEDAVVLINGDNSASDASRQLLNDIDHQLRDIRVLIVSPSVRNGFDIQFEVAGVYGVFLSHTPADSIMQMMMRCRNARTRHLYVTPVFDGQAETNPQHLLARRLQQAQVTGHKASFETHNLASVGDDLASILKIATLFEAEHNRQRNDLFSFTVAYAQAEGFTVAYDDREAPEMRERLKTAREAYQAQKMQETLTRPALDTDSYRALQKKGMVGRTQTHQYDRYQIEYSAGQLINERLYRKLQTARQRANFNRFVNLFEHYETLAKRDRLEAGELLSRRKHHLVWQELVFSAIAAVYGENWLRMTETPEPLSREQILLRFDGWYQVNARYVTIYLDDRNDLSTDKFAIFRRILEMAQQKLSYKRQRQGDDFIYIYWLDVDYLQASRLDALFALVARIKREAGQDFVPNHDTPTIIDLRDLAHFRGKMPIYVPKEGFFHRLSPTEWTHTPF